jgi:hypothetical protein
MFKFSDGNIQVIYPDLSQIVICPATRWLTFFFDGKVSHHRVTESRGLEPEIRKRIRVLKAITKE